MLLTSTFNKEKLKGANRSKSINQKLLRSQELVNAGTIPRETRYLKLQWSDNQRVIIENTLMISKLSLAQLLQLDTFKILM
jgi:outer membrane protein